jgi:hypothetical protein
MSKKIVATFERKKGMFYDIDKKGNVTESKYNWFKDKTTLVVIVLLILGGLYYMQMQSSLTNAQNFDQYCNIYYNIRSEYILNNPGAPITVQNVLAYYEQNQQKFNTEFNFTNGS